MRKKLINDDYLNDHSDRTSIIKDRIMPNISTKLNASAAGLGGAVIGAGLGLAGKKVMGGTFRKAVKKGVHSEIGKKLGERAANIYQKSDKLKRMEKPLRVAFSPEYREVKQLMAAGTGAMFLAPKTKRVAEVLTNTNTLKKQYRDQFGIDPSESELLEAAKLNPHKKIDRKISEMFYTPNAMTKSTFRNVRQVNKLPDLVDKKERGTNTQLITPVYGYGANSSYSGINNVPKLKKFHTDTDTFKHADEYESGFEKVAKYKDIINKESLKQVKNFINKGHKASPYIGAAVGGTLMIPAANIVSDSLIADDDKHSKLKKGLTTAGVVGLGALSGSQIANTGTSVIKGVFDKISNPKKIINNFKL